MTDNVAVQLITALDSEAHNEGIQITHQLILIDNNVGRVAVAHRTSVIVLIARAHQHDGGHTVGVDVHTIDAHAVTLTRRGPSYYVTVNNAGAELVDVPVDAASGDHLRSILRSL